MLFLFSGEELQLGHQNTGKGQNTADHLKGSHLHRIFPHKQTGHIAQPLRKQGNDRLHTHEDCGDGGWGVFLPVNLQGEADCGGTDTGKTDGKPVLKKSRKRGLLKNQSADRGNQAADRGG